MNLTSIASTAKVRIESKNGNAIFSTNGVPYKLLQMIYGTKHFRDSDVLANTAIIPHFITPDTQKYFVLDEIDASYNFTGDENLIITDSGSSSTMYVDTILYAILSFQCHDGII